MTSIFNIISHISNMSRFFLTHTEPFPSLSSPGTTVMTMMAFDADDPSTDNAALRYNIIRQSPDKPSPNMFYIDAERGDIVTVISPTLLDREVSLLAERVRDISLCSHSSVVRVPSGTVFACECFCWTGCCHKFYTCHWHFWNEAFAALLFPNMSLASEQSEERAHIQLGVSLCKGAILHSREQAQKPDECLSISLSNQSETTEWLLFQQGDECQNIDWVRWWKRNISCCQTLSE